MKKWEYITIRKKMVEGILSKLISPEQELNELGEKGWELVSTVHIPKTEEYVFIFKREAKK